MASPEIAKGLKLIAVKIGSECAEYIRKNLSSDIWYIFDKEYTIIDDKPQCDTKIVPDNFYSLEENTKSPTISIHAIVGKNGSGKSALIDFIIRLLNNFACALLGDFNDKDKKGGDIIWIKGVRGELYFSYNNVIYSIKQNKDNKVLLDGNIIEKYNGNGKEHLFYTILLNYSIYAFNTNDYAKEKGAPQSKKHWLNGLFHKNDGYQTPIVLNPMRTEGCFDINVENTLSKDRLISLFFIDKDSKENPFLELNGKYKVTEIKIGQKENTLGSRKSPKNALEDRVFDHLKEKSIYKSKTKKQLKEIESVRKAWENALGADCQRKIRQNTNISFESNQLEHAFAYLIYKTISIAYKYEKCFINKVIGKDVTTDEWKKFIEEIRKDTSHITNKLHQTINYLLGGHNSRIYKDIGGRNNKSVTIDDFSSITVSDEYKNEDKIYRIPPPIYSLEILVKKSREEGEYEEGEKDREHSVSQLSSGEKQLLYTISCILYHIRNINSVADTHATLVKYKNINIILDEIELYFHPEYQREFLFRLIKAIRTMGYQEVHSINILLATHSPFILSDIPQSKVLYLEEGVPSSGLKQETFGANIHSMLKDSFFIENMPIGEFAQKKIERLLTDINEKKKDYDELQREINLVGEPIIRRELTNLLNESYSIDLQIKQKEKELEELKKKKELEELKKKKELEGLRKKKKLEELRKKKKLEELRKKKKLEGLRKKKKLEGLRKKKKLEELRKKKKLEGLRKKKARRT